MKISKPIFYISTLFCILNILFSFHLYARELCILNRGVAFGLVFGQEIAVSIFLLLLLSFLAYRLEKDMRYLLFSIAILGLSNLLVRIFLGKVCDYISLLNISFNIADMGIVLTSILTSTYLITHYFKK